MFELRNIVKEYRSRPMARRKVTVARCLNLSIPHGGVVGLVGESGSGKSSLGRMILGLEPPDSGDIVFQGKSLSAFTRQDWKRFRRQVQMVPQHPDTAFNPKLRIGRSMEELFDLYDICPKQDRSQYLKMTLAHVHLHLEHLERYPFQLSGGEIQRLAIARALIPKPAFILLDEVTSMLDVSVQARIVHLLRDLHAAHRTACLFITHNAPLAEFFCDEVYSLSGGTAEKLARKQTADVRTGGRE